MNGKVPDYGGPINYCSGCGRDFKINKFVHIDIERRLGFCDETLQDCIERWKTKIDQPEAVTRPEKRLFHNT